MSDAPPPIRMGMEFLHRRVLEDDLVTPARYRVTVMRHGWVYYRLAAVDMISTGNPECCVREQFWTRVAYPPGTSAQAVAEERRAIRAQRRSPGTERAGAGSNPGTEQVERDR